MLCSQSLRTEPLIKCAERAAAMMEARSHLSLALRRSRNVQVEASETSAIAGVAALGEAFMIKTMLAGMGFAPSKRPFASGRQPPPEGLVEKN